MTLIATRLSGILPIEISRPMKPPGMAGTAHHLPAVPVRGPRPLSAASLAAVADLLAYGELTRGRGAFWRAAGSLEFSPHPHQRGTIAALERRGFVHVMERCRRHFHARLTRLGQATFGGAL
jgi:hypothetical protein